MTQMNFLNVTLSEVTLKRFRDNFTGKLIIIDEVHNINSLQPTTNEKARGIEEDGITHSGDGKILAD